MSNLVTAPGVEASEGGEVEVTKETVTNKTTGKSWPQRADRELYAIARQVEKQEIDGIVLIGGWSGYAGIAKLHAERERFPAFNLPMICLPASINNNLPGSELSIGSDTALNNIVSAVDKIKTSAIASQRCFVVEVMGRRCGYLALFKKASLSSSGFRIVEEEFRRLPSKP